MSKDPAFKKYVGFRHLIAAAGYSWGGWKRALKESAFRQELAALIAGIALFLGIGATIQELLTFLMLMLVLFAIEAINTAIEEIVDRVSPEVSDVGKNAKDLGSFAVACLLIANGLFVTYVVFEKLF